MDIMDHKTVEEYILSMPNAKLEYPFGKDVAVYKAGDKMFALISEDKDPVRVSLKCDPILAETHWNTVVLTGQLSWPEVQDLIQHSYQLVTGE
jgi:predicted DNA-binding protein (MmcQ/YjbR family)